MQFMDMGERHYWSMGSLSGNRSLKKTHSVHQEPSIANGSSATGGAS